MTLNKTLMTMAAVAALGAGTAAHAGVVTLNFEGIATYDNYTSIGGYYDGGVSGDGASGPDYGVTFSSNALAINSYNGCCSPDPSVLFFLGGGAVTLDYAAGFTTGFSFYYSSADAAPIEVYSGLDGAGTLLATIDLSAQANSDCPPGSSGFYCTWTPIGVSFAGTAESINFGGTANYVGYDDVTFGSATPGGVPEPDAWALALLGVAGVGAVVRGRRRSALATA